LFRKLSFTTFDGIFRTLCPPAVGTVFLVFSFATPRGPSMVPCLMRKGGASPFYPLFRTFPDDLPTGVGVPLKAGRCLCDDAVGPGDPFPKQPPFFLLVFFSLPDPFLLSSGVRGGPLLRGGPLFRHFHSFCGGAN